MVQSFNWTTQEKADNAYVKQLWCSTLKDLRLVLGSDTTAKIGKTKNTSLIRLLGKTPSVYRTVLKKILRNEVYIIKLFS